MAYCYDDYIAHAEEAEGMASKSKDDDHKASWLKIAADYRDLATMAQIRSRAGDLEGLVLLAGFAVLGAAKPS